jgi:hypothetical protein
MMVLSKSVIPDGIFCSVLPPVAPDQDPGLPEVDT